jgi:hypothetical protein
VLCCIELIILPCCLLNIQGSLTGQLLLLLLLLLPPLPLLLLLLLLLLISSSLRLRV